MYPQSEILFPYRAIPHLRTARGEIWQELVTHVAKQQDGAEDTLAFSLMMIRMCDCLHCDQSSYRASLGCVVCARRAVMAANVSDAMLRQMFERARQEVRQMMHLRPN